MWSGVWSGVVSVMRHGMWNDLKRGMSEWCAVWSGVSESCVELHVMCLVK